MPKSCQKSYFKSPIGILEITYQNNALISLKSVNKIDSSSDDSDFIKNVKTQLDEYFIGKRQKFDIKTNPNGTDFQKKVWKELQKIPYGKTKSYLEIATNIGHNNAQRAVGSACNKNPILIIIPCHRVINKSGKIGGFALGKSIKQKLLELESG